MRPARVTEDRKPDSWRARVRVSTMFEEGTEVSPRRALEAFCRCEHTWERLTSDIAGWCLETIELLARAGTKDDLTRGGCVCRCSLIYVIAKGLAKRDFSPCTTLGK